MMQQNPILPDLQFKQRLEDIVTFKKFPGDAANVLRTASDVNRYKNAVSVAYHLKQWFQEMYVFHEMRRNGDVISDKTVEDLGKTAERFVRKLKTPEFTFYDNPVFGRSDRFCAAITDNYRHLINLKKNGLYSKFTSWNDNLMSLVADFQDCDPCEFESLFKAISK